jgi:hypothetical protein
MNGENLIKCDYCGRIHKNNEKTFIIIDGPIFLGNSKISNDKKIFCFVCLEIFLETEITKGYAHEC